MLTTTTHDVTTTTAIYNQDCVSCEVNGVTTAIERSYREMLQGEHPSDRLVACCVCFALGIFRNG